MHITRLRPDPRAPDCLIVEVDGARFASVPADAVRDLGVEAGQTLDGERKERLSYLADVEGAKRVALRLLATRPRSVQEVLRRLRHRGHNPSAAAQVVGRLESQGLLDDRAYAEHFARVRGERGHGRSRLLADLLAKGVDRRLAERSIDKVLELEGGDQLAKARALAEKRVRQLGALPRHKLERRLLAYLARRGFRGREVRDMVGEVAGGSAV
ncbi:MAG: RecX family transcriptional regulator [Gemmatimonadota bacterium]|nr:RecX family transcriptional regulator [Gemmatimonadota bacterium]